MFFSHAGVFSPFSSPPSVELCYRRCFNHLREGGLLSLLSSSELAQLSLLLSKFSKAISSAAPSSLPRNKEEDEDEEREDQEAKLTHRRYLGRLEDSNRGERAFERGGEEEEEEVLERRDEENQETLDTIIRQLFIANLNIFSDRVRWCIYFSYACGQFHVQTDRELAGYPASYPREI